MTDEVYAKVNKFEAMRQPDAPAKGMNTWTIEYDNDTGASDECYVEWWCVSNGKTSFTCNSEDDAVWLCSVLNSIPTVQ